MDLSKYTQAEIEKIKSYYAISECVEFWGKEYEVKPALVSPQGDGLQAVWLQSITQRPHYWVLFIDSAINIENEFQFEGTEEEIDTLDFLAALVADEYGDIDDYREVEKDGKIFYQNVWDDEADLLDDVRFPIIDWGGGSCGAMSDISHILIEPYSE